MKDIFDTIINDALSIESNIKTYIIDGATIKIGKMNGRWYYQFPETGMKPAPLDLKMRTKLRAVGIEI